MLSYVICVNECSIIVFLIKNSPNTIVITSEDICSIMLSRRFFDYFLKHFQY